MTFPKINSDLTVGLRRGPMWQLLQMLVCRNNQQDVPLFAFCKDLGVDGSWLGLSGFDQFLKFKS